MCIRDRQTAALARPSAASAAGPVAEAVLVAAPPDADLLVVAALLHSYGHGDAAACRERAAALGANGREELLRDLLKEISPHDPVPREFEVAALTFELVPSAACFAQLKRHRMTTLTAQDYDVSLGVTIPPSFVATGLDGPFEELRAEAERLHARVLESGTAEAAPYLLLNAHRRRVLWTVNARELYHVARLRLDSHAQWDIRRLIGHVLDLARESAPSLLLLACGKDLFDQTRQDVFGEGGTA
ncbi:MAG: FAD-dependent thymidylate synthase [Candidatus Eisenbacteria bacterium]|nr:FAD-dependent thymidylate synthase [Candidatus Eisenbacteria bacterium]